MNTDQSRATRCPMRPRPNALVSAHARRVASFAGFICLASPVAAATITVPTDQPTIQQAIAAAASGDLILIRPGTYFERLTLLGKTLTLRGEAGAVATIVDANALGRVVHVDGSAVIEGLTIRNGSSEMGAGIYVGDNASATIRNCVIRDNQAWPPDYGRGGGIYIHILNSGCLVEQSTIINNYAGYGGGGLYDDTGFGASEIRGNVFLSNRCSVAGGGAFITGTNFTSNTVRDNWSESFGAGIWGGWLPHRQ